MLYVMKILDFNEKVLHYLLKLPPALEIQSVTCDSLVFTLPWMSVFTDPLIVDFTNVKIVVAEVDHVTEQYDSMPEVDYILELILFAPFFPHCAHHYNASLLTCCLHIVASFCFSIVDPCKGQMKTLIALQGKCWKIVVYLFTVWM